jgi:ankyrin repeat protein
MTRAMIRATTVAILLVGAAAGAQDIFDTVASDDLEGVRRLLDHDPALARATDEAGNTPLHAAATTGSAGIAGLLLARGADIDAPNGQGNTPLHEAIQSGNVEIAVLLVEEGADLEARNVHEQTPLHRAVLREERAIGELLVARGAAIDPVDRFGRTPFLYVARQWGDVAFGRLLLSRGADIGVRDMDGQMALNLAAWRGFDDYVDFLLDSGAEYDTSRGGDRQMLLFAARCGSTRLFGFVMDRESGLLEDEALAARVMRTAVLGGAVEIVERLRASGVALGDDANGYGWTPAHYAARNGHAAMIGYLAEHGFDMDRRTLAGRSVHNIAEENERQDVLATLAALGADDGPARFPELRGPYLGQEPPVAEWKLFAPDIVSSANEDENHGSIAFSPDGQEIYWNLRGRIWMTVLQGGRWTEPAVAPFCGGGDDTDDNPCIAPDGQRLFFTSTRPGAVSENKENIWYVERTPSGWSAPRPVSPEVNAMRLHWGISVAADGTLYFAGTAPDGQGGTDLYRSELVDGIYTRPVNLGPPVNGEGADHCPHVAPDGSYLIFVRMGREEGFFISYRDGSGAWLPPVPIHEGVEGVCPLVTPDGKYFVFCADSYYWLPASFIAELRPRS